MKRILAALSLAAALAGCHSNAQQPVSPPPTVQLSWTAAANCSASNPCVYAISRASIASASASCPGTSGTSYSLIGTSATNVLTLTDSTPPGGFLCYIAQAQTTGSPVLTGPASLPSNVATIVAVPTAPGTPNLSVTADGRVPELVPAPQPTVAEGAAPGQVVAKVSSR